MALPQFREVSEFLVEHKKSASFQWKEQKMTGQKGKGIHI